MKIKIGFSQPKNKFFPIFSWLIRLIEWTKYSHVYLQWDSEFAESTITYHAAGHSVHFLGLELFKKSVKPVYIFEIDITREQYKDLLHYCFEKSGTDYGVKQIFGITIVKLMCLFGKKIKNPFSDGDKSQVCSELIGHVLKDILSKDLDLDLDIAGPKAIYEFMCKLEEKAGATKII